MVNERAAKDHQWTRQWQGSRQKAVEGQGTALKGQWKQCQGSGQGSDKAKDKGSGRSMKGSDKAVSTAVTRQWTKAVERQQKAASKAVSRHLGSGKTTKGIGQRPTLYLSPDISERRFGQMIPHSAFDTRLCRKPAGGREARRHLSNLPVPSLRSY